MCEGVTLDLNQKGLSMLLKVSEDDANRQIKVRCSVSEEVSFEFNHQTCRGTHHTQFCRRLGGYVDSCSVSTLSEIQPV